MCGNEIAPVISTPSGVNPRGRFCFQEVIAVSKSKSKRSKTSTPPIVRVHYGNDPDAIKRAYKLWAKFVADRCKKELNA
jgi:hypothetical protein